ncbi:methyltransferase [Streptomyces collinus]|uniref:methyltransferase n=1 Tax=Streptomyces collinus TaxID=42684 RepID=UPI0036E5BB33
MSDYLSLPDLSFPADRTAGIADDKDNPWLTLGIMDRIEDPVLLREWGKMLDLQTRVLGPGEVDWLRQKGFARDSVGILEPGSGDGHYGSYLARCFGNTPVHGLEANEALVRRFDQGFAPSNYNISICTVGSDDLPEQVQNSVDQCLLRFVLQHVSDPGSLVRAVYDALPSGGKLYAIEEDHSFFTTEPYWLPYALATDAWSRVYEHGGSDAFIGRKLPSLLSECGFEVTDYDIILRNNVEMGDDFPKLFSQAARVLHHTAPDILPLAVLKNIDQEFTADRGEHRRMYVATYPQILVCATKP